MKKRLCLCCCLLALLLPVAGWAQTEKEQDIIYLEWASKIQQIKKDGIDYQRVIGPAARFLHNNTYVICDTAIWYEKAGILDAVGNIQIFQGKTRLTGETVHYIQDQNLAQVRGRVVELFDNKNNHLRTQYLDFNTKDSIGIFYNGGSMIDSTGNVLESLIGHYFSKENLFTFEQQVFMHTDSVLLKADNIHYKTDENTATLLGNIHAWHANGYLRSHRGKYHRDTELFHFTRDVFVETDKQEVWADTLNYDRIQNKGALFGNIQIRDTTQSILLLGDEGHFENQPQKVLLTKKPAVILYNFDKEAPLDSLFARADSIRYEILPIYQADSLEVVRSEARLRYLKPPPAVTPDSTGAASTSATSALNAPRRQSPSTPTSSASPTGSAKQPTPLADTTGSQAALPPRDSLQAAPPTDTTQLLPPSVPAPPPLDTTAVRFLYAWKNVKLFRTNDQGICDSLVSHTLDSTARLYGKPVLWHENNQFSADSIQFFFQNNQISRADLISSAFVIAKEENAFLFNQIKGNDMIARFRDSDIYKFEVMGSAETIFCIPEDSVVTMLEKKTSKNLIITLKQRQVQQVRYLENIKGSMHPLYDLSSSERLLANFNWRADERPVDRFSITPRSIRPPVTNQFQSVPQPTFPYTQQFFPKHVIPKVRTVQADEPLVVPVKDSVTISDPLPELPLIDSLSLKQLLESIRQIKRDTLAVQTQSVEPFTPQEQVVQPLVMEQVAQPLLEEAVTEATEQLQTPPPTKKELRALRKQLKKEQRIKRKEERKNKRLSRQRLSLKNQVSDI